MYKVPWEIRGEFREKFSEIFGGIKTNYKTLNFRKSVEKLEILKLGTF